MNKTQQLLNAILEAGSPIPEAEIALKTGRSVEAVRRTIENAMAFGYLKRIPSKFEVTAKGVTNVELGREGKTFASRANRAERSEWPTPSASSVVSNAKANRHPLDTAWGGA